ncbi:MAG: DUF3127 domain-containing protein [Chitinophagaceae bacterium]
MAFEVTGKLVAKFEIIQRTESFRTREFVIETSEDIKGKLITNYIKFQSTQDRTTLIDRFNMGDPIKVSFNIKGSKWEKNGQVNYITNLDAWRIEQVGMQNMAPTTSYEAPVSGSSEIVDDLPF